MANARAHRFLDEHEDALLTFTRIQQFKGFAAAWMQKQGTGYRHFHMWCRTSSAFQKGRAAMTKRLHEISCYSRRHLLRVSSEILRPYENADYSRVPVVRVPDSRISWLGAARLFPKFLGMQVMVHTRDHPPPHIHIEFLKNSKNVRLKWRSLEPLDGEPELSEREKKAVDAYVRKYEAEIQKKCTRSTPRPLCAIC